MPSKPTVQNTASLNGKSVDILNAIRSTASPEYRAAIPEAEPTLDSIRSIGSIIMQYSAHQNEFLTALVNRIGMVIITSRMYSNPWAVFKKGMLEYGETVEEIFTNLAKPFDYDPADAENTVWRRAIPDVRAAFHTLNYQKGYEQTVQRDTLKQAFLSWDGVTQLIASITQSMYSAAEYDELLTMKYLIARLAVEGAISTVSIPAVSETNMRQIVATIKGTSNTMEFMSPDWNMAGVQNFSKKEDQFIILTAAFDASVDVDVLAASFNMDKAQFMGRRMLVDSFSRLDSARLQQLFGADPGYIAITAAQLQTLDAIQAVIVDREFMMIFDVSIEMNDIFNPKGRYWNYFLHTWKIFSASPFAQAALFTTGTNAVSSVSVTPATNTATAPATVQLTATVTGTGIFNKSVTWSVDTTAQGAGVSVSSAGLVSVPTGYTGTVTVTATSVADNSKSGTATITVAAPTKSDENIV